MRSRITRFASTPSILASNMPEWQCLEAPARELRLEFTLVTGQSFRWRKTGNQEYTGVIQQRVVRAGPRSTPFDRSLYGENLIFMVF
jgi:hypothetical protein